MPKSLSASEYSRLKADLQQILKSVRDKESDVATTATVEGYWKIGHRIAKEKLDTEAGYHNSILRDISDDRERAFYEDLSTRETWSYRKMYTAIRNNRYLESRRSKNKQRIKIDPPSTPDYRYKVEVRRVIDADTIIVDIDVGFEMLKRETLRLARIDCLERGTTQGELARRFVQSVASDIHGRYIAHVFYTDRNLGIHTTVQHGEYLNQKLLDRGYAKAH